MRISKCAPLIALLLLTACNAEKEQRNKECSAFADWSNHAGDALANAAPEAETRGANTNEKRAAMFRKLAEEARKSAKGDIPFKDSYVRGLATRHLKIYEDVAVALDHQADAWEKGDGEAQKKAVQEEMNAKAKRQPISDEWMKSCRL